MSSGQLDASAAARMPGDDGYRHAARGDTIFVAGEAGEAFRVRAGVVRLDRESLSGADFGGLALAGDVIGAETLMFGAYTYTAVALSPVVLESWLALAEQDKERKLMVALAARERRTADVLALRCGKAVERIKRLLSLLAGAGGTSRSEPTVTLPRLRDIADITDLKVETVSRTIAQMNDGGELAIEARRFARLFYTPDA